MLVILGEALSLQLQGMAISIWEVSVTDAPLESAALPNDAHCGAVVEFWGVVRASEDGREIEGIEYEVHRAMAEHQMNLLAQKAATEFSLAQLVLRHRVGFVKVGEASLFLRAASRHRSAAFVASEWLIDELKRKVPIWKRPIFKEDGAAKFPDSARVLQPSAEPT